MIPLSVYLDGDRAWPDLAVKDRDRIILLNSDGGPVSIAVLDRGMASGRPSVMLRFELPDGRTVLAETSALLFCTAGQLIESRWPDLFEGGDDDDRPEVQ